MKLSKWLLYCFRIVLVTIPFTLLAVLIEKQWNSDWHFTMGWMAASTFYIFKLDKV